MKDQVKYQTDTVEFITFLLVQFADTLGSLSTHAFVTGRATGREHFGCQDSGVSHIFVLIIPNGEKELNNVNMIV